MKDRRSVGISEVERNKILNRATDDIGMFWPDTHEEWAKYCITGIKPEPSIKGYILPTIAGTIGFFVGGGILGTIGAGYLGKELNSYLGIR